ncbi:hypothetical protein PS918_02827 [Pseudomonas fluorescens]|uniref:HTH tetR-type domain-containing protein n=1 Tax=Pseudomonas fluorescens TaxID=294 RepID=A0A5E7SLG7_PSEFL|nr:TetR/AcrR family transcriptional regulator [Pseudomonas fluorescens]VVP86477.1 hypothetical protein PS918_02827 [Pseudomonas fluorescens]
MPATLASAPPEHSARDRLLDAAAELFATRGFQAISLRDLASRLGLHAGSLYHHIENKQSLLFELIESALSDLLLDTTRRLKGARNPGERLNRFIQSFVTFHFNERDRLVLMTREFASLNEEQRVQIVQLKNRYAAVLSAIVSDLRGEKSQPGDDQCPITRAVIVVLFGQSQWYCLETAETQLVQSLKNVVMGIVGYNKTTEAAAVLQRVL